MASRQHGTSVGRLGRELGVVELASPRVDRATVVFSDRNGADSGVKWNSTAETERLLSMMSKTNLAKFQCGAAGGSARPVGTICRRTRPIIEHGTITGKQQRAEVRFDGISGCLRTPSGGSSRQTVLVVEGAQVRSRLISPREAARLMGVPENYPLPAATTTRINCSEMVLSCRWLRGWTDSF